MKARIAVERVHAAAVASLPYWQEKLDEAEAKARILIDAEIDKRIKSIFWPSTREGVEERLKAGEFGLYCLSRHYDMRNKFKVPMYEGILEDLQGLIKITAGKAGFNIQLSESEYNKIWTEL